VLLLAQELRREHLVGAALLGLGVGELGPRDLHVGLGLRERASSVAPVHLDQGVARVDDVARLDAHLQDLTGGAGLHVHHEDRLDRARRHRRDRDAPAFDRDGFVEQALLRLLAAAEQSQGRGGAGQFVVAFMRFFLRSPYRGRSTRP